MATATDPETFSDLLRRVEPIAPGFAERGHRLHLVGGCVRDTVLGIGSGEDLDLTTDARPEQILEIVEPLADAVWTQGERFGTIGARIDGQDLEITTHRTESYEPDSRKPEVVFADALEEDLARRDFTINAMAVDVADGSLVDPHDGMGDLDRGRLRTPLTAAVSFTDDPLRMLRAGRFLTRFGLDPSDDVRRAAIEHARRLDIVSAERVLDELKKLLLTDRPARGLAFLDEVGVLERVLPEADLAAPIDESRADPAVRFAVLLASTDTDVVIARLNELKASGELSQQVARLVAAVRSMPTDPTASEGRRWAAASDGLWRDALEIGLAVRPDLAEPLAARLDDLAGEEDLDDWSLPVDGRAIMAALGLEPGPAVGRAVARLNEHRLEHGPFTAEEALDLLRET